MKTNTVKGYFVSKGSATYLNFSVKNIKEHFYSKSCLFMAVTIIAMLKINILLRLSYKTCTYVYYVG